MTKLIRLFIAATLFTLVASSGHAQVARYVAGTHFETLDTPVRTADAERIEVIELFWYGCPGCYAFEPLMAAWEEGAPADVDHKRLPAVWDPLTQIHAKAYYTAVALGALDAVHQPFFDEYHQNRNRLQNEVLIREFFESCGISRQDFDRIFNSFTISTQVNQARNLMAQYSPRAQTPSIFVNGKYVVKTSQAVGSYQEMLNVVEYLINLERG